MANKSPHFIRSLLFFIGIATVSHAALAVSPPSSWDVLGSSFTSKQAAENYIWSYGSGLNYFTIERLTWISATSVSYTYTAPMRSGVPLSDWDYFHPVYGGASQQTTESALVAWTLAQIQATDDPGCPASSFEPIGAWTVVSSFYDQVSTREEKEYQIRSHGFSPSCDETVSPGQFIIRDRSAGCITWYSATNDPPHCHIPGSIQIIGDPLVSAASGGVSACVGNPCDVATGDKIQRELDYAGAGLKLERVYHSQTLPSEHALGAGWMHNYHAALIINGDPSGLLRPDGYHNALKYQDTNFYISEVSGLQLKKPGSDWVLYKPDGEQEVYDSDGRLMQLINASGQITELTYTDGLLTSVTGPFGHSLQFSYVDGRVDQVLDPDGQAISYDYDGDGNLEEVVYPDLTGRLYHYEDTSFPHHLTGITDENNDRFSTYAYDSDGLVISTEHAGGFGALTLDYLSTSTTVTDQDSTVTTYSFTDDSFPRRIEQVSLGDSRSLTVPDYYTDFQRRPTDDADERGVVTHFVYDLDHLTSKTEAYGTGDARITTYEYLSTNEDLIERQTSPSVSGGGRVREVLTSYTGENLPEEITITGFRPDTTPIERTTTFTYTAEGQVETIDGPRTDVDDLTTFAYYDCDSGYECGQLESVEDALGYITTYDTYDAHGRVLQKTDPNGLVATYDYDLRGRVQSITTTPPVGSARVTAYAYDDAGQLETVTLPNDVTLTYGYDAAHQLTSITDMLGNEIRYSYDLRGNRESEEVYDPYTVLVRAVDYAYDVRNQLLETDIAGAVTETVRDAVGLLASDEDPNSNGNTYDYDPLRRLTEILDAATGTTEYDYDVNDQMTQVTAPNSVVTQYVYDDLGNLLEESSADTGTATYTHDDAGNVATRTDARSITATYTYDELNRVTEIEYPGETLGYEYDQGAYAIGRLDKVTDNSGETRWSYNAFGQVETREQEIGAVTLTLTYDYDADGQLAGISLPSDTELDYSYTDGKITGITVDSTTLLSDVLYEPFGPTAGWTWANTTLAVRTYDSSGRIDQIDSAGLKSYDYDAGSRILGIADAGDSNKSWTYDYDALNRLDEAVRTGLTQTFSYDANGNRLSQGGTSSSTYTIASSKNRLSSISGALSRSYSYDNAGHTTGYSGLTFIYNDAGRMTAVSGGVSATYSLNALGQRVKKVTGGVTTYFVYDEAGHLIGEYDGSENLIQETVYLEDIPVATLRPNGGSILIYYIHTDHLNTPRKISRPSDDAILWRWDSDPFGSTAANEDPDADSTLFKYHLRFPGQYFDAETGLHYNYYRDYDPATGRYPQSDPIGLDAGINTYAYALNNPISLIDPFGLQAIPPEPPGPSPAVRLDSAIKRGDINAIENMMEALGPEHQALARNAIQRLMSKAEQIISKECKGSINREFPSQFRDKTLKEIMDAKDAGDDAARKALKLLTDKRFKK